MGQWKTKQSKAVYENPWVRVYHDEVVLPSGQDGIYGHIATKGDAVSMIVKDLSDNFYLMKEYRYPLKKFVWSIPGGSYEEGVSFEELAKKEVKEEIGVAVDTIEKVGFYYQDPALLNYGHHCYVCTISKKPNINEFEDADIAALKKVTEEELKEMIRNGELCEAKALSAFALYFSLLK